MSTLRAWLEISRISNLPTVWTNCVLGAFVWARGPVWTDAAIAALAGSLMYIAGMIMNDVFDAGHDAAHRPSRPIPSGRLSKRSASIATFSMLIIGVVIFGIRGANLAGALLAIAIISYNAAHRQPIAAALLMGACRAILVVAAGVSASASPEPDILTGIFAGAIGLYTGVLTIAASNEHLSDRPYAGIAAAFGLAIPIGVGVLTTRFTLMPYIATGFLVVIVPLLLLSVVPLIRRTGSPVRAIMALIAGFCTIDALYLAIALQTRAGLEPAIWFCWGCYILTTLLHRRILGT